MDWMRKLDIENTATFFWTLFVGMILGAFVASHFATVEAEKQEVISQDQNRSAYLYGKSIGYKNGYEAAESMYAKYDTVLIDLGVGLPMDKSHSLRLISLQERKSAARISMFKLSWKYANYRLRGVDQRKTAVREWWSVEDSTIRYPLFPVEYMPDTYIVLDMESGFYDLRVNGEKVPGQHDRYIMSMEQSISEEIKY